MYELTIDSKNHPREIRACDMKVENIGEIIVSTTTNEMHLGDLVLCAYGCVISLTDPHKMWRVPPSVNKNVVTPQFMVRLLAPGQKVTLEII